eukprot:1104216-Amphidinium_carterae.1
MPYGPYPINWQTSRINAKRRQLVIRKSYQPLEQEVCKRIQNTIANYFCYRSAFEAPVIVKSACHNPEILMLDDSLRNSSKFSSKFLLMSQCTD